MRKRTKVQIAVFFSLKERPKRGREWRLAQEVLDLIFRERVSFFSLSFCTIRPLAVVGTRGKVALRIEAYAWVPVLLVVDKLLEVGVSPYLVLFFV